MSRIRVLVLLAAVAALVSVLAACGGGGSSTGSSSGSSESSESSDDPQTIIENATLEGVKSGNLELSLDVNASGDESAEIEAEVSGPFEAGAGGAELPQAEMAVKLKGNAQGQDIDFDGDLTLLTDKAFIGYEGTEYEVDPTTFGLVKSGFEQAQQESGGEESSSLTACQKAAEDIKVGDIVENFSNDGSEDVGGTETTKISGDLNIGGALDAITELGKDPACAAQLESTGTFNLDEIESQRGEIEKAVKNAHAEVFVGDDNIIRKVDLELELEAEGTSVEVSFDLAISEVNEPQSFDEPSGAQPIEKLFEKIGVNPLELMEAFSGGSGLGSFGGGSSESSESPVPSSGAEDEFTECLESASTPNELQKCASLLE